MKPRDIFAKTLPVVLPVLSIGGVIATALLAGKATEKAVRKVDEIECQENRSPDKIELVTTIVPLYIPTFVSGAATIFCIIANGVLNKKQQAALLGAYAVAEDRFRKYSGKVKDIYGEEAHNKIMEELAVEGCEDTHILAPGLVDSSCLAFEDDTTPYIFYDAYSDRYFETTLTKVLQAEYHLNRNYALGGVVTYKDFYDFLGVKSKPQDSHFGWTFDDDLIWIDFNHRRTILKDGSLCYIIETPFSPQDIHNL